MMLSPGDSVRVNLPNRSMVQSYPCGTVLMPANSVKMTSNASAMAKISKPFMKNLLGEKPSLERRLQPAQIVTPCGATLTWSPQQDVRFAARQIELPRPRSYPALKLAQHQLPDHVHAGLAVVEAGAEGKLLAAIMPKNLGVFLGDFFQRFQAIGGETGGDHGYPARAVLGQLRDGLVGIR